MAHVSSKVLNILQYGAGLMLPQDAENNPFIVIINVMTRESNSSWTELRPRELLIRFQKSPFSFELKMQQIISAHTTDGGLTVQYA